MFSRKQHVSIMERQNKHKTGNNWRDSNICKDIGVSPLVPVKHIDKGTSLSSGTG
jgi:hypothetical protein